MRRSLLLALLLLLAAPAAGAAARSAPCLPDGGGPRCHVWTGKVTAVNDGDTIKVRLGGRVQDVRFAAVQAMELIRHHPNPAKRTGQCHGLEATSRVEQLVRASGGRVRLTAEHPESRADRRLARFVAVRRDGRWQDLGAVLTEEGHTLFLASSKEPAWNRRYDELSQQAALGRRGIWNPAHCGAGPAQDVSLRIWARWDPPGLDNLDLNGEWTKVRNDSPTGSIDLGGWWVRDSMQRRFTFPPGTVLAPGATLTLYTGPGEDRPPLTFHWGLGVTLYPNIGDQHLGDGAYLFDLRGDLRAAMTYPCLVACAHPAQGALALEAQPRGAEGATVRNVSGAPVDLSDALLDAGGSDFPFGDGARLAPGEALTISFGDDLGLTRPILRDGGGSVRVATYRDITLACDAWGSASC